MANFSSWGLSADGHMKPDLSAPGYELYSPSLKNTYEPMSGTSSASPHAMGIVSLVQEHVKKNTLSIAHKSNCYWLKIF